MAKKKTKRGLEFAEFGVLCEIAAVNHDIDLFVAQAKWTIELLPMCVGHEQHARLDDGRGHRV